MNTGTIGLGPMGADMTRRIPAAGPRCVVPDPVGRVLPAMALGFGGRREAGNEFIVSLRPVVRPDSGSGGSR